MFSKAPVYQANLTGCMGLYELSCIIRAMVACPTCDVEDGSPAVVKAVGTQVAREDEGHDVADHQT